MTRQNYLLALVAGSILAISGTGFGQAKSTVPQAPSAKSATKNQAKTTTSVTRGTVKAINGNQITIDRKVKGKDEDLTLVMDSATQKQGNIAVGASVTVRYRYDNNQDVATMVRVETPKRASK